MTIPITRHRGSAKAALILALLAFTGIAMVGAGTLLYLNRDKLTFLPGLKRSDHLASSNPADGQRPVVASSPQQANEQIYASYMNRDDVLVLVDYYADWCKPCREIAPALSRLASSHGDKVVVLKVNVDREKGIASRAGVRSIPDVRLHHGGKQLDRVIGGRPYGHYESMVLNHAHRLSAPSRGGDSSPAAPPESAKPATPAITPLKKDWLPPGVSRVGS